MTYKFCTLSLGSTTSVNLIPKRSPIITTSPFAIIVPLAKISKGSPASLSNSIKDALNIFLEDKEGFGGVEGIHFTSFVLQ